MGEASCSLVLPCFIIKKMATAAQDEEKALRAEIRKRLAEMQASGDGVASAERSEAAAMRSEASAFREAGERIAEAIASSKEPKPDPSPMVFLFLVILGVAAVGGSPLICLAAFAIGILFVSIYLKVKVGAAFTEAPFIFWALVVVVNINDAINSFAWTPSKYTSLFALGFLHWMLFVKPGFEFDWSDWRDTLRKVGSLFIYIGAYLLYGLLPILLSYILKIGIFSAGASLVNVVMVMGLPVVLAFILKKSYMLECIRQFLLILAVISLVMYAYNAGLSQSLVKMPFDQGISFSPDQWGAVKDFFNFFLTPIKDAVTRFYYYVYAPACVRVIDGIERTAYGDVSGISDAWCPLTSEASAKQKEKAGAGGIQGWLDKRIAFATGQVEETKEEPPGVTLSPLEPQSTAVEHQPITVRSKVRAVALDKPLTLDLFCKAVGQKSEVSSATEAVKVIPSSKVSLDAKTKLEKGIVCLYEDLDAQTYSFMLSASFDFKTVSYLKVYFATDDQVTAAGSREDWFDRYGITDTDPEPKYTPGPVSMGVRVEEPEPIILYPRAAPQRIFMNIPVSNAYQGKLRSIDKMFIIVPEGLAVEGVYGGKEKGVAEQISCAELPAEDAKGCSDDLGFVIYEIKNLKLSDKEAAGIQYRAILQVQDYVSLLGQAPPSIQYIKVILDYQYVLEQRSSGLTVEKGAAAAMSEVVLK